MLPRPDISAGSWLFLANTPRRPPHETQTGSDARSIGKPRVMAVFRRRSLLRFLLLFAAGLAAVALECLLDRVLEDHLAATMAVMIIAIILLTLFAPLSRSSRR
jgi:hypothetical protein